MKRIISMAIGVLLLLGTAAFGQSLGEVARSARKGKTHQSAANHQYDDDNLPKNDHLSVVGPAPAANANGSNPTGEVSPQGQAAAQATATADKKAPAEERQRAAEEWKNKIDDKKQKVASLSHELGAQGWSSRARVETIPSLPRWSPGRSPGFLSLLILLSSPAAPESAAHDVFHAPSGTCATLQRSRDRELGGRESWLVGQTCVRTLPVQLPFAGSREG